jgi:hypothetical protein
MELLQVIILVSGLSFMIWNILSHNKEQNKILKRMEIGVQNQMDREKELLERIKYLESLTK